MNQQNDPIELEMSKLLEQLNNTPNNSEEYRGLLRTYQLLLDVKKKQKTFNVSPDVLLTVGGNLVGIVMVLMFERFNVLTSRAMSLLMKPKHQ